MEAASNPPTTKTPFQRSGPVLLLFVAITIATIVIQTWWAIAQDKQLTIEAEAANGLVAVRLLEEHATQTVQDALHTLAQVTQSIQIPLARGAKRDQSIRRIIAEYELKQTRHLKTLQFVNPDGRAWVTPVDAPAHFEDVSERPYIKFLMGKPLHREAIISHPYPSRYDSQLVVPIARNVYDEHDKLLGIISVDLRLSYFGDVYARVAKDNNASVALIANEGFVFVRSPFEARYLDRDISQEPGLATLVGGPAESTFSDDKFLDDEWPRLYAYKKIPDQAITAVYGREFESILAPWKLRSRDRVLFSGGTIALIAGLTFFLQLYISRLRTSRRSLLESEAKFVGLFQRSPVPMVLLRQSNNTIAEVNDAWLKLFGYQKEEVIGKTSADLSLWVDTAAQAELTKQLTAGNSIDYMDAALQHKAGKGILCLLSAKIFNTGEDGLVIITVVDVTVQRGIENEIRELNQELEERVASRTRNLAESNHSLSEALNSVNAMQGELIRSEKMAALGSLVAGVSHELNTPIGNSVTVASTIREQTQALAKSIASGGLKKSALDIYMTSAARGLDILMTTLGRAADLVSSFKQVAVDQSSNFRRQFKLNNFIEELLLTLHPMYRTTPYLLTVELSTSEDIVLDSYPGALGQIITNLLANAVKHGFDGAPAGEMRLTSRAIDLDRVEICFSDNGLGIPEEHIKKVFDPFFTTKLGQGGSGLGMHIVYNIATEVLGGKIALTSEVGKGTTITLTLPLHAPIAPTVAKAAE